jgi:hypothetical protein
LLPAPRLILPVKRLVLLSNALRDCLLDIVTVHKIRDKYAQNDYGDCRNCE